MPRGWWRDAGSDTGICCGSDCATALRADLVMQICSWLDVLLSWTAQNWPISASRRLLLVNTQASYGILT